MILAFSDSPINCFVPMDTHTHTHGKEGVYVIAPHVKGRV